MFVPDGFHSQLIVAQAGTVKFDFVPDTEIVPLLNCGHLRFRIICHHLADEPVARNFAALAEELFILGRIFVEEAGRQFALGDFPQFIHPFLLQFVMIWIGAISIHSFAVNIDYRRHVVDRFHAPFYLQAVYAALDQVGQVFQHRQIDGTHGEFLFDAFFAGTYRVLLPQQRHIEQAIFPTARLRAASAVGITVRHVVGQDTTARVGDAHRPMDEGFDFDIGLLVHFLNFCHRYFTGQNDTFQAFACPEIERLVVGRGSLGRQMDRQAGCVRHGDFHQRGIRNQHRIDADIADCAEEFACTFFVAFMGDHVRGDIDLRTVAMCKSDCFSHFLIVEIACAAAQSISFSTDIDGISSVVDGCLQFF
ncbi:hypothetical protein SDC9_106920 [bioreactor metagenome]|uniref:Uncharacterized protein n=1 Tax=bioreactor metagenome TaxID=1076179 RepID=A0A645BA98_9ZZZZ